MAQQSQQGTPTVRPPFILPGAPLPFPAPPPGFPPPGFVALPPHLAIQPNAAATQLLYAHQLMQSQINAAALQHLVRQQPPPPIFANPPPQLPTTTIAQQQPPPRPPPITTAISELEKDNKKAENDAVTVPKTSQSDHQPLVSLPFSFANAPPPNFFTTPPPPFAIAAVSMTIPPQTMTGTARPPPRPIIPSATSLRPNRPSIALYNSASKPPSSAVPLTGVSISTPELFQNAAPSRRREEFQQNLVFKVDEAAFLSENRNRVQMPSIWTRCVPSEPYFNWTKEGTHCISSLYQKLVGDFELSVVGAPARVNSSRMLEPPPRPVELDTLYLAQGHHHHKQKGGVNYCCHHHQDSDSDGGHSSDSDSEFCDSQSSDSSSDKDSSDEAESGEISDSGSDYSSSSEKSRRNGKSGGDNSSRKSRNRLSRADNERADMNAKLICSEIEWRSRHPAALHSDIWFNLENLGNFGPTCRCSIKARRSGFRHNVFPHERYPPKCNPASDNRAVLQHFRLDIKPNTNLTSQESTKINWDDHIYTFDGFSLLVHGQPATAIPPCSVNRYGIMYTIELVEEPVPTAFSVAALDFITDYILKNLLNLFELDWLKSPEDACRLFHVFPRFARNGPDGSKELLSIPIVLMHLVKNFRPVVPFDRASADKLASLPDGEWNDWRLTKLGQLVTKPGYLPGAIRLDQVDRVVVDKEAMKYEVRLCHWTTQPQQMNYLRNATYVRAWRKLMKYRYLLSNKSEITQADRQRLRDLSDEVARIQSKRSNESADDRNSTNGGGNSKGRLLVELNPAGFYFTGLRTDVTENALFLPAVIFHMRVHGSLRGLEAKLDYQFKDRSLFQLALTHSSYTGHIGTNADHIHNTQANCGVRHPVFGDTTGKSTNPFKTRRKGVVQLTQLMASIDRESRASQVPLNTGADMHNERLEFLGDAVLSFIVNRHIFFMFPNASEGTLSIYHSALVSNENFFRIAKGLELESYLLYSHGPDLCVRSALDHAMANTIEALHGAIYLESGLEAADEVFARLIFGPNSPDADLAAVWQRVPPHPLQAEEPNGDRHWIEKSPVLQRLTKLEESIGVEFTHIRLLAQSMANIDTAHVLTRGNNERLEFFGDYILQLVVTDYLFHKFPRHHEGGLSLLRATLLQATTQALMAKDLHLADYLLRPRPISKKKTLADILEAFVGALYVDKGLDHVRVLCDITLLPRLHQIVLDQSWNDPKSRLQMLCITQRDLDKEPDMPRYRVLAQMPVGPNGPRFEVAVYFRRQRLAVGVGRSKQEAEVAAAQNAIATHGHEWAEMRRQERLLNKVRNGGESSTTEDFVSSLDSFVESKKKENKVKISSAKTVGELPNKRRKTSEDDSFSSDSSESSRQSGDEDDKPFRFPGPCNDPKETTKHLSKSAKKRRNRKKKKQQLHQQQQQKV